MEERGHRMDKDNKLHHLIPGWREKTSSTIPPPYINNIGVDQINKAMSLAENRYLQSLQLSAMNDRSTHMSQAQPEINAPVPSFSQLNRTLLDSDSNRINRCQNVLPVQDPQLYFNQEHKRLRDRLIQEILETKQPTAANQQPLNSSQLFQDTKDYNMLVTTTQKKNLSEEMERNVDKLIREEANRMELFVKQKQREEKLQRLCQEVCGPEYMEKEFSQQIITQSEKTAKNKTTGSPKEVSSRRKNSTSSTNSTDKNVVKGDMSKNKCFAIDTSKNRKITVSNYYDTGTPHPSWPAIQKAGASVDIVDLTDDGDNEMESTAALSDSIYHQRASLAVTAISPSTNDPPPPIAQILSEDEENNLRLSLLLDAIDMDFDKLPRSSVDKPCISMDIDDSSHNNETFLHNALQIPFSYSKESVLSILSALKRNKELFKIERSEDIRDMIPQLPSEPCWGDNVASDDRIKDYQQLPVIDADCSVAVTEPTFVCIKLAIPTATPDQSLSSSETWWPKSVLLSTDSNSNSTHIRSKPFQANKHLPPSYVSAETDESLTTDVEPGVIEKLPYCRLAAKRSNNPLEPISHFYCVQVTTKFCMNPLLCCSECYTWRHAECGGHYTGSFPSSIIPSDHANTLKPICDRCHTEQTFLLKNPYAIKRLRKQRIEHLRREQMTSAVMNEALNSNKLKWPIKNFNDAQHSANLFTHVDLQYEKAIKQWNNMIDIITTTSNTVKGKVDIKEREYDRLLKFFDDAEEATDRHNMILFLQRDIARKAPVGFEDVQRNIFDPVDNSEIPFIESSSSKNTSKKRRKDALMDVDQELESIYEEPSVAESFLPNELGQRENCGVSSYENEKLCLQTGRVLSKRSKVLSTGLENGNQEDDSSSLSPVTKLSYEKCVRSCCSESRRFDSFFCSDGCGVASMESDLLRSLMNYASYRNKRRTT